MLGQYGLPGVGERARAWMDRRAVSLHQESSVWLLVVAHLHHVNGALETEQPAGHREGTAPLSGAGFGREPLDPGFLVVVGLSNRRIRFVATNRTDALVFVVNSGWRLKLLLQSVRPVHRRRTPELVDVADLVRYVDPALPANLLKDEIHREKRGEIRRANRLHR